MVLVASFWSAAAICLSIRFLSYLTNFPTASTNSVHTSAACSGGVNSGRLQCWENRSNDTVIGYAIVSGTKNAISVVIEGWSNVPCVNTTGSPQLSGCGIDKEHRSYSWWRHGVFVPLIPVAVELVVHQLGGVDA